MTDDLISRKTAIDAVEESRRLNHHQDGKEACAHEYEHRHFLKILMALPTAQPEIIRCKDCKHYYYADNRIPQERRYSCDLDDDRWKPEDFCSFAERREE